MLAWGSVGSGAEPQREVVKDCRVELQVIPPARRNSRTLVEPQIATNQNYQCFGVLVFGSPYQLGGILGPWVGPSGFEALLASSRSLRNSISSRASNRSAALPDVATSKSRGPTYTSIYYHLYYEDPQNGQPPFHVLLVANRRNGKKMGTTACLKDT